MGVCSSSDMLLSSERITHCFPLSPPHPLNHKAQPKWWNMLSNMADLSSLQALTPANVSLALSHLSRSFPSPTVVCLLAGIQRILFQNSESSDENGRQGNVRIQQLQLFFLFYVDGVRSQIRSTLKINSKVEPFTVSMKNILYIFSDPQ